MSKPRKPYNKKAIKAKPNDRMTAERKPTPPPQRVPDEIERKIRAGIIPTVVSLADVLPDEETRHLFNEYCQKQSRISSRYKSSSRFIDVLLSRIMWRVANPKLWDAVYDADCEAADIHFCRNITNCEDPRYLPPLFRGLPLADFYGITKIETQGAPAKRNPQDEVATLVYEVYMTDRIWKNPFPGEIRYRRRSINAAVDYVRVKCPKTDTEFYDRCTDARTAISNLGKTKAKIESLWRTIAKKKAKPSGRGDKSNTRKTYTKSEMMQYIEENGGNANDYDNRRIYPTLPCSYSW